MQGEKSSVVVTKESKQRPADDGIGDAATGIEISMKDVSPKLKYMLLSYKYLQTALFIASIAYILVMRVVASKTINNIENIWNWEEHCKEIYYFFAGASYGVATLGFVNFFLVTDALKKLEKESVSVRVIMKNGIEFIITAVELGILISVYFFASLDTCGTETDRRDAKMIYMASFFLCTLYLCSLLSYNYLRILMKYNSNCKHLYRYLLKGEYL